MFVRKTLQTCPTNKEDPDLFDLTYKTIAIYNNMVVAKHTCFLVPSLAKAQICEYFFCWIENK
jgi:hypothetical protein